MRQSQRAKTFQVVSSQHETHLPKLGFVYRIDNADELNRMIGGNRLQGTLKNGDFVLALSEKGDHTTYAVFEEGNPAKDNDVLMMDPYATFTMYGKPGATVRELPAWMIQALLTVGVAPVAPSAGIEHLNAHDSPGTIQRVESSADYFHHDTIETKSMQGKLKDGDLVLIVKHLGNGRKECALMEPLTLGWREKADSRFVANQTYFGRAAAILSGNEYLTVINGGVAHYKDHGRDLDFGRVKILSEVERGWPQP